MAQYYVSSLSGSDTVNNGTSNLPYQTVDKAYAMAVTGDTIFLKKGEVFPLNGETFNSGGGFGKGGITVDGNTYGTDPGKAKLSGFYTIPSNGWTNAGGGIWYHDATSAGLPSVINAVTVDGTYTPVVRWPKTDYYDIQSHTWPGGGVISGSLTATFTDDTHFTGKDFTGGEIVFRATRWTLQRAKITTHNAETITVGVLPGPSDVVAYNPTNGNGYFIQNHSSLLTQFGEWAWDNAIKRFYMYFGASNPSTTVVKVSKLKYAFSISSNTNKFQNLAVEGYNAYGFVCFSTGVNMQILNCDFKHIGQYPIYAQDKAGWTVTGNSFTEMPNNAILGEKASVGCDNWTVNSNTFSKIGWWPGMGMSNDQKGTGVYIHGTNLSFRYNSMTDLGYVGINFRGSGCAIEYNYFNNFCTVKDDGAAIYTFEGQIISNAVQRSIRYNLIFNGMGVAEGIAQSTKTSEGVNTKAHGIYLDEYASQVMISNNLVVNCLGDNHGIFLHKSSNNSILNNILYKNGTGIKVRTFNTGGGSTTNVTVSGNIFIVEAGQYLMFVDTYQSSLGFGTLDSNYYYAPDVSANLFKTRVLDGSTIQRNFASWKTAMNADGGSTLNNYTVDRLEYNNSTSPVTIPLSSVYRDPGNSTYYPSVTLSPYNSILLFPSTSAKLMSINGRLVRINGKFQKL